MVECFLSRVVVWKTVALLEDDLGIGAFLVIS